MHYFPKQHRCSVQSKHWFYLLWIDFSFRCLGRGRTGKSSKFESALSADVSPEAWLPLDGHFEWLLGGNQVVAARVTALQVVYVCPPPSPKYYCSVWLELAHPLPHWPLTSTVNLFVIDSPLQSTSGLRNHAVPHWPFTSTVILFVIGSPSGISTTQL